MEVQPQQQSLFAFENPLKKLKPREFFLAIPRRPGIYRMLGAQGQILYVGKAKCLRDRINSYRQAKPAAVSRKVIRMLYLVREIQWEECLDEKSALLRENELLRTIKPPFNRIGKSPESYVFIAIREIGDQVRFRLTRDPKRQGDLMYGVFRCRRLARAAYQGILRLCWALSHPMTRFEYPQPLTRHHPPPIYTVPFPIEWGDQLKSYLSGADEKLIGLITDRMLEVDGIPPFYYRMIQDDLDLLRKFFELGPRRNRQLKRTLGFRSRLIPQCQIDDLLVMDRDYDSEP